MDWQEAIAAARDEFSDLLTAADNPGAPLSDKDMTFYRNIEGGLCRAIDRIAQLESSRAELAREVETLRAHLRDRSQLFQDYDDTIRKNADILALLRDIDSWWKNLPGQRPQAELARRLDAALGAGRGE